MTYSVYYCTCANLIKSGLPKDIFCFCFFTLQWNLISGLESTDSISLNNLWWEDDHIKIFFPRYKSDQAGLTSKEPRHIYSNPFNLTFCPVRALARYLISFQLVLGSKNGLLFPDLYQKKRFGQSLHSVLKRHSAIGVIPKRFGYS